MKYEGEKNYKHGMKEKIGILITNLGTPDKPNKKALKIYLKEFLSDPRVIEVPKLISQTIPHAEMVKFEKTGSNAVTGAVRAARYITKRNKIAYCGSGGVWHDWWATVVSRDGGIPEFNRDLIYMVLPLTQMHTAAKMLDLKYACEIFADRNYNDKGLLIDRSHPKALIKNSKEAIENISLMIEKKAIKTISGKFLKTDIDSVCIHGDGNKAVQISNIIKKGLIRKGIEFLPLNKLSKFN